MNLVAQGSPLVYIRNNKQIWLQNSKIFCAIPKSSSFREPTGSQEKVASKLSLERMLEIKQAKGSRG